MARVYGAAASWGLHFTRCASHSLHLTLLVVKLVTWFNTQVRRSLSSRGFDPKNVKNIDQQSVKDAAGAEGVPLAAADGTYTADDLLNAVAAPAVQGYPATNSSEVQLSHWPIAMVSLCMHCLLAMRSSANITFKPLTTVISWWCRAHTHVAASYPFVSGIRNQGSCGACVGYAFTGLAETAMAYALGNRTNTYNLAEQW